MFQIAMNFWANALQIWRSINLKHLELRIHWDIHQLLADLLADSLFLLFIFLLFIPSKVHCTSIVWVGWYVYTRTSQSFCHYIYKESISKLEITIKIETLEMMTPFSAYIVCFQSQEKCTLMRYHYCKSIIPTKPIRKKSNRDVHIKMESSYLRYTHVEYKPFIAFQMQSPIPKDKDVIYLYLKP